MQTYVQTFVFEMTNVGRKMTYAVDAPLSLIKQTNDKCMCRTSLHELLFVL